MPHNLWNFPFALWTHFNSGSVYRPKEHDCVGLIVTVDYVRVFTSSFAFYCSNLFKLISWLHRNENFLQNIYLASGQQCFFKKKNNFRKGHFFFLLNSSLSGMDSFINIGEGWHFTSKGRLDWPVPWRKSLSPLKPVTNWPATICHVDCQPPTLRLHCEERGARYFQISSR